MALAVNQGMKVFPTVKAALEAGYQVYDRYEDGYLVRIRTDRGWAMALAEVKKH